MNSAVIFASFVPNKSRVHIGKEILDKIIECFGDCDLFVGVNPSCIEWIELLESYKEKINIFYKITEDNKVINSDASAYQTALSLYKEKNLTHDLLWFAHTKGITSNSPLRYSVYKIFFEKRNEIENLFKENTNLGLFMPWMIRQLPKNKNYVENNLKHILIGDKFKKCSDLTGHYTFYVIKGEVMKNFMNDVIPDFFEKNLLTLGVEQKFDMYFFERDFPMIVEKYGYETYPNDHSWALKYE